MCASGLLLDRSSGAELLDALAQMGTSSVVLQSGKIRSETSNVRSSH